VFDASILRLGRDGVGRGRRGDVPRQQIRVAFDTAAGDGVVRLLLRRSGPILLSIDSCAFQTPLALHHDQRRSESPKVNPAEIEIVQVAVYNKQHA
jgi:hypothetical protein